MRFINVFSGVSKSAVYADVRKVVDLEEFRPDSEKVRSFKINPTGSGGSMPLYDYPDGKVPNDDTVTDLVVSMRSGKYDKADIDNIRKNVIESSKRDSDSAHSRKIVKALDSVLGIDKLDNSNSSNNS